MMMTMCWILPIPLASARRAGGAGALPAITPMPSTMAAAATAGSHRRRRGLSGRVVPRMLRLLSYGGGVVRCRPAGGAPDPEAAAGGRCLVKLPAAEKLASGGE